MKRILILTTFFTIGLLSCNSKNNKFAIEIQEQVDSILPQISKTETLVPHSVFDSTKKLIGDDYPVTNKMLAWKAPNNQISEIKCGEVYSLNNVWFKNDTLKQSLVFELYTDYHRINIFHFYNNDIPADLIKKLPLYVSENEFNNSFDTASFNQKKNSINGFVKGSRKINNSYFITKKGFKLGDSKDKAINIYGKPHESSTSNHIEKCEWRFVGDCNENLDETQKVKIKRPLVKDSFGYNVTMYFRDEILIAMILFNDIP